MNSIEGSSTSVLAAMELHARKMDTHAAPVLVLGDRYPGIAGAAGTRAPRTRRRLAGSLAQQAVPSGRAEEVAQRLLPLSFVIWALEEVFTQRAEFRACVSRLAGRKVVQRAKSLLQPCDGINEEQTYQLLKTQGCWRRITLAAYAERSLRIRVTSAQCAYWTASAHLRNFSPVSAKR
jgi:hypothetical protein